MGGRHLAAAARGSVRGRWPLSPDRFNESFLKTRGRPRPHGGTTANGREGASLGLAAASPALLPFEDICLKETMSLADSLYNLQLIQEFCHEYLNGCCHFTLEDMLYAASAIKVRPPLPPLRASRATGPSRPPNGLWGRS